jgi:hypothetical protein
VSRQTALYRLFDGTGRLLYVGIGFDPKLRWRKHAKEQAWWPLVADRQVTWYPTRDEAERAEEQAIAVEGPLFNVIKHRQRHRLRGDGSSLAPVAQAADEYRVAVAAYEDAKAALVALVRKAHSQDERQSAILRAAKHVWSREYLRIVLGLTKRKGPSE